MTNDERTAKARAVFEEAKRILSDGRVEEMSQSFGAVVKMSLLVAQLSLESAVTISELREKLDALEKRVGGIDRVG